MKNVLRTVLALSASVQQWVSLCNGLPIAESMFDDTSKSCKQLASDLDRGYDISTTLTRSRDTFNPGAIGNRWTKWTLFNWLFYTAILLGGFATEWITRLCSRTYSQQYEPGFRQSRSPDEMAVPGEDTTITTPNRLLQGRVAKHNFSNTNSPCDVRLTRAASHRMHHGLTGIVVNAQRKQKKN